jgi:hypothetical protein
VQVVVELLHERIDDILVHEGVVGADARLPRVETLAPGDALGGALDVGVLGDKHRALAAELQRHAREALGGMGHDLLADARAAGEHDLVEFHLQEPVVHGVAAVPAVHVARIEYLAAHVADEGRRGR